MSFVVLSPFRPFIARAKLKTLKPLNQFCSRYFHGQSLTIFDPNVPEMIRNKIISSWDDGNQEKMMEQREMILGRMGFTQYRANEILAK